MKRFILGFLVFLFSFSAVAQTSLWKVSIADQHIYLAGTIHVLAPSDLPFPKAFDKAYKVSDIVVLETDMSEILNPNFQARLMAHFSYSDGRLLTHLITPELYQELQQYLRERGLMPHIFIGMKPAGVMLTMLGIEFQRLGISEDGADTVYYQKAINDGKSTLGLESIEDHIGFIAELGEGNEERYLKQTLEDMKETESMMREMVLYWKSGDAAGLEKIVIKQMKDDYPKVYQSLLVDRNERWLPQIKAMLTTPDVEFVLVGAAHLIGPDGILKELIRQGYSVEQM
ncbi:TraB/GumN family protein [Neptuniibacter sp. QD29_5]|uniref:TraB/GumN family protein n=1 Tax=Neptuniibacter sp. QD29_5 TaxID=3398207 RepID=UPI0039F47A4B